MAPEFGVVFSEARLIGRVGRLQEETDQLEEEVAALRREVKILRAQNFLLTKDNFEIRKSVIALEYAVGLWSERLTKVETDIDSLCAGFNTLKLSDDA